ncbi:hypothetical protein AVEN_146320-1, partial [Araneus ventricosus]
MDDKLVVSVGVLWFKIGTLQWLFSRWGKVTKGHHLMDGVVV